MSTEFDCLFGVCRRSDTRTEGRGIIRAPSLTLSTTPSFASRWPITMLPRLADLRPEIVIMIDASDALRHLPGPDRVDLAVRWASHLSMEPISRFFCMARLALVCSPEMLQSAPLGKTDGFADAPLISDGHSSWAQWFELFGKTRTEISGPPFS